MYTVFSVSLYCTHDHYKWCQSGVQSCTFLHVTNADLREGKIYGGALKPPPSFWNFKILCLHTQLILELGLYLKNEDPPLRNYLDPPLAMSRG